MRSRASRLFGGSSISSTAPKSSHSSRPPSRTLTLTSPTIQSDYEADSPDLVDSFGDFDFGVQKLADSLSFSGPIFEDNLIRSSPYRASAGGRWSVENDRKMQEIQEEHEDDDEQMESDKKDYRSHILNHYQDDEHVISESEYEDFGVLETITATRITLSNVGKPILIDVITHSKSRSGSARTSSYTTRSSSYSYSHYDSDKRSHASSSNSSISEKAGIVPTSKSTINYKPFARRKHERTDTNTSTQSHRLDTVEKLYGKDDGHIYVETAEILSTPVGARTPNVELTRKRSFSNLVSEE